jgi:Rrf2 family protein
VSDVVRFSEASAIALHAMAILAAPGGGRTSIRDLAGRLPISGNHLAKVMQRLSRAGLVESTRGPSGGFRLRGDPSRITLLDVHEAIEGRLDDSCCLLSQPMSCAECILGDALRRARAVLHRQLARTRLSDVDRSFTATAVPPPPGRRRAAPARPARRRRR